LSSIFVVDKAQARLESLEDEDENSTQTMLNLSQQEYVKHIDELQQQLVVAWDTDQRVKALKIAIQVSFIYLFIILNIVSWEKQTNKRSRPTLQNAKLLSDTKVAQFYPSKFVLITEILDTFGRLVFDRIFLKAANNEPGTSTPIMLKGMRHLSNSIRFHLLINRLNIRQFHS